MAYIDWEYYSSHFPKLNESDFNKNLIKAEMLMDIETRFRSKTATGYKLDQTKACVANLVNKIAEQEETGVGNGVKSVSNDGYSESYDISTQAQADAELRQVCVKWLSGTGLMGVL